jgi:hypothetical protein
MQKRTQDRYRQYDETLSGTCPSCRTEWTWSDSENAWQAIHRETCGYIAWWRVQQVRRKAEAAATPKVPMLEGAAA